MNEICDFDSDDRELFAGQLCIIGSFGRIIFGYFFVFFIKLLENRIGYFEGYFVFMKNFLGKCFDLICDNFYFIDLLCQVKI